MPKQRVGIKHHKTNGKWKSYWIMQETSNGPRTFIPIEKTPKPQPKPKPIKTPTLKLKSTKACWLGIWFGDEELRKLFDNNFDKMLDYVVAGDYDSTREGWRNTYVNDMKRRKSIEKEGGMKS